MSNYFYLLGILYVLDLLKSTWISLMPNKGEVKYIYDANQLASEVQEANKKAGSKKYLTYIVGNIFFIWAIIGYCCDLPEKNVFLYTIIVIISRNFVLFIIGGIMAYNMLHKAQVKTQNINEKPKFKIPLSQTFYIAELYCVSHILYHHYFLSNI